MWGATGVDYVIEQGTTDFNPRAPCGARRWMKTSDGGMHIFQSTRPVWGATTRALIVTPRWLFQSTRPVWGATGKRRSDCKVNFISIHAPRVGRDLFGDRPLRILGISIHAPRVGRDAINRRVVFHYAISIHAPRVGRDAINEVARTGGADFNPRAPCGARLLLPSPCFVPINFNPRAPCGARLYYRPIPTRGYDFNPRAPCGARLQEPDGQVDVISISIHAPRVGRDEVTHSRWLVR